MTLRAERFDRGTTPAPLFEREGSDLLRRASVVRNQINSLMLYPTELQPRAFAALAVVGLMGFEPTSFEARNVRAAGHQPSVLVRMTETPGGRRTENSERVSA